MAFRIGEETLGPEVAKLLEEFLGCKVVQQGRLPGRKQFDLYFEIDGFKIVVELEIGGWQKLPVGIVQAEGYREQMAADGVIAIVYPEEARREETRPERVRDIALTLPTNAIILCPFLKDFYAQISLAELAAKLRESLATPISAPSVTLVVETLRQAVQGVSLEIGRSLGLDSPLVKETVGSLPLFQILAHEGEETPPLKWKDEERVRRIVADLASYILVNQLLLYRILSNKLNFERKMKPVLAPIELNGYFKQVTDINYRAVFCVNVASTIPPSATSEVNIVIGALGSVQPENLRHDLLGRIFHEFLPPDTRKRLGTFYTRPQAAEILAALAIDRADDRVLDPACGSGTLLVAAYRRKSAQGKLRSHKKLVEEELTGVDIMPFAAHLAALNLTMQSPLDVTNKTRIGVGNSLALAPGGKVDTVSAWLRTFAGDVTHVDGDKGDKFQLEPVHVAIMNPPFTRRERVAPDMRPSIYAYLGEPNYWAYFVAMAASFLKKGGRIAAVLPRDFFRGQYSRPLRERLFKEKEFGIRYIVKSTKDWAFSEAAAFRDFLVVLKKGYMGKCALVYLNKPVVGLNLAEAEAIGEQAKLVEEGETYEDESISVVWRDQEQIWQNWSDLGHLAVFNTRAGERLLSSYQAILKLGAGKLALVGDHKNPPVTLIRGFEYGSEDLQRLLYIVRPLQPKRLNRAAWVLSSESSDKIMAFAKGNNRALEIPRNAVKRGLRTSAYVPTMSIGGNHDYVVLRPFPGFDEMLRLHGVKHIDFRGAARKAEGRFTHLVLNRRFDFTAPGTSALAFFSEEKVLPVGLHWSVLVDSESARVLCLWFNSSFYLTELLLLHTETRGSYMIITEQAAERLHVPLLTADTSVLSEAFEQIKDKKLPPLAEQFSEPPPARLAIDRAVLRFLGYDDNEIEQLLPTLYEALHREMTSFKELMKGTARRTAAPEAVQMHLMPGE